jgi:hypothetical protein
MGGICTRDASINIAAHERPQSKLGNANEHTNNNTNSNALPAAPVMPPSHQSIAESVTATTVATDHEVTNVEMKETLLPVPLTSPTPTPTMTITPAPTFVSMVSTLSFRAIALNGPAGLAWDCKQQRLYISEYNSHHLRWVQLRNNKFTGTETAAAATTNINGGASDCWNGTDQLESKVLSGKRNGESTSSKRLNIRDPLRMSSLPHLLFRALLFCSDL